MGRGSAEPAVAIELEVERFGLVSGPVLDERALKNRFQATLNELRSNPDRETALEAALAAARETIDLEESKELLDGYDILAESLLFYDTIAGQDDSAGTVWESLRYLVGANPTGSPLIVSQLSREYHLRSSSDIQKTICGRVLGQWWKVGTSELRDGLCGSCFESACRSFPEAAAAAKEAFSEGVRDDRSKLGLTSEQRQKALALLRPALQRFLQELPYGEIVTSTELARDEMWEALLREAVAEAVARLQALPERGRAAALLCDYRQQGMSSPINDCYYLALIEKQPSPAWPTPSELARLLSNSASDLLRKTERQPLARSTRGRFLAAIAEQLR